MLWSPPWPLKLWRKLCQVLVPRQGMHMPHAPITELIEHIEQDGVQVTQQSPTV